MTETNPYGANQYHSDPRQKLLWEYYINPKSDTFSNAYQSALRAGYTESSSSQITTEDWFKDKLRRLMMLTKAEKVLDETLEMSDVVTVIESGTPVEKRDIAISRLKQDTAKFISERLGKDQGYTTRTEQTGKDGADLIPPVTSDVRKLAKQINDLRRNTRPDKRSDGSDTVIVGGEASD